MKAALAFVLLGGLAAGALRAQAGESLWFPEGYRLLSEEERQGLPAEEVKTILARNTEILREAVARMTPEERTAMVQRLSAAGEGRRLSKIEAQYVAMTQMLLLAQTTQEQRQKELAEEQARFQKLLRDQEETTKGFPGDAESVQKEAWAIEALLKDASRHRDFYLRVLKPLRARPWNDAVRVAFRKIVRSDSIPRPGPILYDAATAFLHSRQAESPEEGAWYSLEAFLKLSMRGETAAARKLFATAIEKGSRDIDVRIYPLLIAEIEGEAAEVARLRPWALEAYASAELLDRDMFYDLGLLPYELQQKARATFERRYKQSYPAEWGSRERIVAQQLEAGRFQEVASEAAELLMLPVTVLPEPHRTEFLALKLRARAGLGQCDESVAEIARLESSAAAAYPWETDPDAPPPVKTVADVRVLKAAHAKHLTEDEELLKGRDDAAVAAEWTRREMRSWLESRGIPPDASGDLAGRAERLSIQARSASGKCLLGKGRALEAARVLAPCIGRPRFSHFDCVLPLVEAARALVAQGKIRDSAAFYEVLSASPDLGLYADEVYADLEKASPGLVKRRDRAAPASPRIP